MGAKCVEVEYVDADGVQVSIVINLDSRGDLYEVDFWKIDFSPLRCYPRPEQVKVISSTLPAPAIFNEMFFSDPSCKILLRLMRSHRRGAITVLVQLRYVEIRFGSRVEY